MSTTTTSAQLAPEIQSETKTNGTNSAHEIQPDHPGLESALDIAQNTENDALDMSRLGKKQEFKRNFRKFSTLSFTTIIMATYEVLLIANFQALTNGGRAGFVYSYIWTTVGFAPIIASLAEMSSM
jgi:amino acid permease